MASPFKIFRKHQRQMIAVLGVMTMFAFVFLGQKGCDFGLSARGPVDPVVVTTTQFGSLRQHDLQNMMAVHRAVLGFLERLILEANPTAPAEERRMLSTYLEQTYGRSDANGVLDTWLLAQRAEQLGIVVSDETVKNLINTFAGGDRVPMSTIKTVIANMKLGQRQLLEALRTILLAQRAKSMFLVATGGLTPAQRWDYYQRLRLSATIQLAALPVEKFTASVKENPTDAVLAKFFDEHKDRVHDPEAPEPGFREPQKIAFAYFKADVANFVDPKTVSDAEVQKYYDDHKQQFISTSPVFQRETAPPSQPESKPLPPKPATEVKKDAPKASPPPAPAAKTAPAAQKAPAPAPAKKAEPDKKGDAGHKSSALRSGAKFQWTAYLADKDSSPASGGAAKSAATPQNAAPKPAVAGKPAAASKVEAAKQPPVSAAAPQKKEPATAAAKTEPEKKQSIPPKPVAPPKEEYKPLAEVKDEIRNSLAQQKARERILDLMTPLRDQFNAYATKKIHYDQDQKTNPNLQPPQPLDLKAMAQTSGMSLYTTEPISRWKAAELDIAKSYVDERIDFVSFAYRSASSSQLNQPAVSETGPQFSPDGSKLLPGNVYLFWKTEDNAEYTPKFDDKGEREKVLQQWKQVEARKLAIDDAEQWAKKARDEKKSLKDALHGVAGIQVVECKPFSWITIDMAGSQSQLRLKRSAVDGVDDAGPDFMQAVFGAEAGDFTVAMNYAKTSAYVIQIVQFAPPAAMLMKEFETEKPNFEQASQYNPFPQLAAQDRIRLYSGWLQEIRKQAGFTYTPMPDTQGRSRPVSSEDSSPPGDMDF